MSNEAKALIEDVRTAIRAHARSWEALVPDAHTLNLAAEGDEERAFDAMADAKRRLQDHILHVYGVSARELAHLAVV